VPLVVAVGRLVPVKRFHLLVEALVRLKPQHPDLRAVLAGEGYERPALEALIRSHGRRAGSSCRDSWTTTPSSTSTGRLGGGVVVAARGLGMTVTEAGACGTPSVATRIGGHEDAVVDGTSGLLVDTTDDMVAALDAGCGTRCSGAGWVSGSRARRPPDLGRHRPGHTGRAGHRGPVAHGLRPPNGVPGSPVGSGRGPGGEGSVRWPGRSVRYTTAAPSRQPRAPARGRGVRWTSGSSGRVGVGVGRADEHRTRTRRVGGHRGPQGPPAHG